MEVSVIIVNYNTKGLLIDCLKSIERFTVGLDYEIIVVDNASSDGSQQMIRTDFPNVQFIESKENLGFGRANNLGSDYAKGDYLFYLNSDTILTDNAIKTLYDRAVKYGDSLGALGCILKNGNNENCHSYGNLITPGGEIKFVLGKYLPFLKDKSNICPPDITEDMEVGYVTGADMMVPSAVYKATGGFDKGFFMYCEETEWQDRMAGRGLKRIVVPSAGIIHLEGGSNPNKNAKWSPRRLSMFYSSKKIYQYKHFKHPRLFRAFYKTLLAPTLILLALRDRDYIKVLSHI